jgi:hypothetical protein
MMRRSSKIELKVVWPYKRRRWWWRGGGQKVRGQALNRCATLRGEDGGGGGGGGQKVRGQRRR